MIPIRKDWQEPYFGGHYVPLVIVLVIAVPFSLMLLFATQDAQRYKQERDEARAQMVEVRKEIDSIDERIETHRKFMLDKEIKLQQQYTNMLQRPPIWPPETLVADQPSVNITRR